MVVYMSAEEKILCGIVTFNPDIDKLKLNMNAISIQADTILVVDNGSNNFHEIEHLKSNNIEIIGFGKNCGIACALNEILKYSNLKHFKWILFLDQDSISPQNMITKYISMWGECNNCGMLSPKIKYKNGPIDDSEELVLEKDWCITSGSFTKTEILNATNGFDESMFIDMVDYDICCQLKHLGYKTYQINNVEFYHELGNLKYKKVFNKVLWIENHNAFRKYYIVRNRLYIKNKYKLKSFPVYFDIFVEYLKVIIFEKDKIEKIKRMNRGIKDARKMPIK